MTILFGTYSVTIKSITAEDAGLTQKEFEGNIFYLKQKCFHLFFIPVFPLGKFWVAKRGFVNADGDWDESDASYECSEALEEHLYQSIKTPNTLWAWTAPIIALLVGAYLFLEPDISRFINDYEDLSAYNSQADSLINELKNVQVGEYILFRQARYYYYSAHVDRINKDSIFLSFFENAHWGHYDDPSFYTREAETENPEHQTITLSSMIDLVSKQKENYFSFSGFHFDSKMYNEELVPAGVKHTFDPVLKKYSIDKETEEYYFEIVNRARYLHTDSVVSNTNGINWELSKKRDLPTGETIAVRCSAEGDAFLYCTDSRKKQLRFLLSCSGPTRLSIEWLKD